MLKNSSILYENDKIMLKDRIIEFEGLKNDILIKIKKRTRQSIKNLIFNRVRCDICKIDIHKTSYSRHLKREKRSENTTQKNVIVPRKNPIKRVVEENTKESDTKNDNQNFLLIEYQKLLMISI